MELHTEERGQRVSPEHDCTGRVRPSRVELGWPVARLMGWGLLTARSSVPSRSLKVSQAQIDPFMTQT